jgi:hypothetical protein
MKSALITGGAGFVGSIPPYATRVTGKVIPTLVTCCDSAVSRALMDEGRSGRRRRSSNENADNENAEIGMVVGRPVQIIGSQREGES